MAGIFEQKPFHIQSTGSSIHSYAVIFFVSIKLPVWMLAKDVLDDKTGRAKRVHHHDEN